MDNFGGLIGLVAGGVWLWRRRRPDSSLAGCGSDRFDTQLSLRPTHGLKRVAGRKDTRG